MTKNQANLRAATALVIISPFEADQLLSRVQMLNYVTLHMYAPWTNQMYKPLDTLNLYTVGKASSHTLRRDLIAQFNLFAGQLYFRLYEKYIKMCGFLGLSCFTTAEGQTVQSDGFVLPPAGTWKLPESPVRYFKDFIVRVRREGDGIDKTHLGRMLEDGIERRDFEKSLTEETLFVDDYHRRFVDRTGQYTRWAGHFGGAFLGYLNGM